MTDDTLAAARRVLVRTPDADPADEAAVVVAACRRWQGGPIRPWRAAFWLLTAHASAVAVSRYRSLDEFAR